MSKKHKKMSNKDNNETVTSKDDLDFYKEKRGKKRGRKKTSTKVVTNTAHDGTKVGETRATFILKEDLLNNIKVIASLDRVLIKSIINEALGEFVEKWRLENQNSHLIKCFDKAFNTSNPDLTIINNAKEKALKNTLNSTIKQVMIRRLKEKNKKALEKKKKALKQIDKGLKTLNIKQQLKTK